MNWYAHQWQAANVQITFKFERNETTYSNTAFLFLFQWEHQ